MRETVLTFRWAGGKIPRQARLAAFLSVVVVAVTGWATVGAASAEAATIGRTTPQATGASTSAAAYRWGGLDQQPEPGGRRGGRRTPGHRRHNGHDRPAGVSNSASYVLTSDGTVWAWGLGGLGQLGNGATADADKTAVKVAIPTGVTITRLANPMPFDSGLALDSTGHVWGWGHNGDSSMCLPGQDLTQPTEVPGLADVTVLTGQGNHSLFDAGGTVVGCGGNPYGELGDGTKKDSSTPVSVVGLPDVPVVSLESSWHGSGALLANGAYYDWGFNAAGQMGIGRTTRSVTTPQKVPLEANAQQVFQGGSIGDNGQTLALLSDGTVWAWGNGRAGQLGDGSSSSSDTPVPVSVPNGVSFVQLSTGGSSSYAVDSTGAVWSWGSDKDGALGDGSTRGHRTTPARIAGGPFTYVTSTAINVGAY